MKFRYKRTSSLQRLMRRPENSAVLDLMFAAINWIPISALRLFIKFITLPGLSLLSLIVGLRFHQMHHSNHPADYDSNYGNLFTFWDALFQTGSKRYRHKGSEVADTVPLGRSTKPETAAFNRWHFALINETWIHYGLIRLRGKRTRNRD
jgi:hypothetical protein